MSGYIERIGGEIVTVWPAPNMRVPLEMLEMGVELDGELFRMHPLGGGWVADSSYVPDTISIPREVSVGRNTRVITNMGMSGIHSVWGNLRNPNEVSRFMDDEGRKLRNEQRLMGVAARVIEIERRQRIAETAAVGSPLF